MRAWRERPGMCMDGMGMGWWRAAVPMIRQGCAGGGGDVLQQQIGEGQGLEGGTVGNSL